MSWIAKKHPEKWDDQGVSCHVTANEQAAVERRELGDRLASAISNVAAADDAAR